MLLLFLLLPKFLLLLFLLLHDAIAFADLTIEIDGQVDRVIALGYERSGDVGQLIDRYACDDRFLCRAAKHAAVGRDIAKIRGRG